MASKVQPSYIIGVDVGGTKIAAGLVNPGGCLCKTYRRHTDTSSAEASLLSIVDAVEQLISTCGVPREQIRGVGVGVPGLVEPDEGIGIASVNLNWRNVPVKAQLESRLGLPCAIENDVRAAAMGELYYGSAKGLKDFIYLNIGTGIAASIILNGKIHRGAQGLAGEIGHAMIDRDGPECKCGGTGCLEAFAAGPAIAETAASRLKAGAESILGGSTIMSEGVFRAATQGDPLAKEILTQTGAHIAFALQFLILAFGPELVVLGGGVPMGGNLLIESVRSSLERQAHASWVLGQVYRPEMIQLTKLGEETGIIGASALIASLK